VTLVTASLSLSSEVDPSKADAVASLIISITICAAAMVLLVDLLKLAWARHRGHGGVACAEPALLLVPVHGGDFAGAGRLQLALAKSSYRPVSVI
jgi:hypothetical protein